MLQDLFYRFPRRTPKGRHGFSSLVKSPEPRTEYQSSVYIFNKAAELGPCSAFFKAFQKCFYCNRALFGLVIAILLFNPQSVWATGQTTRVSVASDGTQGNSGSGFNNGRVISADGRYVFFESNSDNLVPGDSNGLNDVFVHDRVTGQTTLVSVASDGSQGNNASYYPSAISADGRYVVFNSDASNLVPGDTNGTSDTFVHDLKRGETVRVTVASDGSQPSGPNGPLIQIHGDFTTMSAKGRYAVFNSDAYNLVSGDTNGIGDTFVHDRLTGQTTRVNLAWDGSQANPSQTTNATDSPLAISSNGRYVAFTSASENLVPGDSNGFLDVFIRDRMTNTTTRASLASDGTQGNSTSYVTGMSSDGRFVVFVSSADNLVPGDSNGAGDIFVRDRKAGQTILISVASDGSQSNGFNGLYPSISADGRYVAFESSSSNLVPGDANGQSDAFVRDIKTGQTSLVSVASDGTQGNNGSFSTSISANGRYVVFLSNADNLVPGDTNNNVDVFVHDRLLLRTAKQERVRTE